MKTPIFILLCLIGIAFSAGHLVQMERNEAAEKKAALDSYCSHPDAIETLCAGRK